MLLLRKLGEADDTLQVSVMNCWQVGYVLQQQLVEMEPIAAQGIGSASAELCCGRFACLHLMHKVQRLWCCCVLCPPCTSDFTLCVLQLACSSALARSINRRSTCKAAASA